MVSRKIFLRLINYEYLILFLAALSLLISCAIASSKKFFWNDELYSYYLLADHSFAHMLVAFHDKINNTPPLYFILGWLWSRAFGTTELSLRLFSCIGICFACLTVWIVLRRTYSFFASSFGVLVVFCTSSLILAQNAEARMYGLFLAVCSLGLFQYDSINRSVNVTRKNLFLNTCIHAAIVHTHLFGILYSGAILASHISKDILSKSLRVRVYVSIVLAWVSLLFYIPSFLNQADAGYPRTWIPVPSSADLTNFLTPPLAPFLGFNVLVLIILLAGVHYLFLEKDINANQLDTRSNQSEISLLIFAYSFLLIPILVWLLSKTIKPVFIDRYVIPSLLGWSVLLAFCCSRLIPFKGFSDHSSNRAKVFLSTAPIAFLLSTLLAMLLIYPVKHALALPKEQFPGLNDRQFGYENLPIVTALSHDFVERFFYSPNRNQYYFVLDWEAASSSESGLFTPQEYKHLDALNRSYPEYFSNHIIPSQDFLEAHQRFLVLDYVDYDKKCGLDRTWDNFNCPQWLEKRILNNPRYTLTSVGEIDSGGEDRKLLLVEAQQEM